MKQITMPTVVITAVVALAIGFGTGYLFKGNQQAKLRGTFVNGQIGGAQRFNGAKLGDNGGAMGRGGSVGTILSMDDNSVTIKLIDGSSKIILLSETTKYSDSKDATKSDLKIGSDVSAFGTPNSDGSVTATSIQLNPQFVRPSPTSTPGN